ncbi:hypothetical protein A249_06927 [Pseudomonas syringae pv. actinidiae ICMP 18804]|uniref:Uncharacterized protein n=1 Tax=Pseudomonas syringae pv. actinidiae ICMP 19096 TaxID=1194405 RepID=A0A656JND1_PSESF|nr:hypothetical protein A249_06927 [Pseudomonas syringae pv. actinidiae ICMP 18804]EPN39770.1 hypothetical protein A245_36944 [Pseudomonas syringae pv. actinidiae ICMP 19096]
MLLTKPRFSISDVRWKKHELGSGILQIINGYLAGRGLVLRKSTLANIRSSSRTGSPEFYYVILPQKMLGHPRGS